MVGLFVSILSYFLCARFDLHCELPNFFFFNDTAPTEIYTLSLHDALPIYPERGRQGPRGRPSPRGGGAPRERGDGRSEEHTSELQSLTNLVCRLLLEKKKHTKYQQNSNQSTTAKLKRHRSNSNQIIRHWNY